MDNTLNSLIARLGELRLQRKEYEFQAKEIGKSITAIEYEIMDALDAQQLTESGGPAGKVILGESVYPQVENWEIQYDWQIQCIKQAIEEGRDPKHENMLHFFEKRIGVLAYREALDLGIAVPGILPFTKRKITFKET